jgi:IPT/TIG domain
MTRVTIRHSTIRGPLSPKLSRSKERCGGNRARAACAILATGVVFAALILLVPRTFAQSTTPHITEIDPASGKVNDTVTVTGTNLGKGSVTAVFLSDDKSDYKATLVDQSGEKLVFKVPQVKAGAYNLSVQIGAQILILPTHFTVEQ